MVRLILVAEHADFKYFAEAEPKVVLTRQPLAVEQVLQLGQVGDLEGTAEDLFNLFLLCIKYSVLVKPKIITATSYNLSVRDVFEVEKTSETPMCEIASS